MSTVVTVYKIGNGPVVGQVDGVTTDPRRGGRLVGNGEAAGDDADAGEQFVDVEGVR
jgi:hypothetical protein